MLQTAKRWELFETQCRVPCSNAAKTRNPLKFASVPQTRQEILAVSGPKFITLRGLLEEVFLFNTFFPIVDTCLSCELRHSPSVLCDGADMAIFDDFLRPVFSARRVHYISDLHSKFALGPHHLWKYGRLVEEVFLFNTFFPIVDRCLSCKLRHSSTG